MADQLLALEDADPSLRDVDMSTQLDTGRVTFLLDVFGDDAAEVTERALATVRAAIHRYWGYDPRLGRACCVVLARGGAYGVEVPPGLADA